PAAGTIGVINGVVGQWTSGPSTDATKSFIILADLSDLTVQAQVSESDIAGLQPGQKVSFTVDAWPNERFTGSVLSVTSVGQTVQNVVTYQLVVSIDKTNRMLLPGMTANLTITTDEKNNVLTVPNRAIQTLGNARFV